MVNGGRECEWTRGEDDVGMGPLRGFKLECKHSGLPFRSATSAAKWKMWVGIGGVNHLLLFLFFSFLFFFWFVNPPLGFLERMERRRESEKEREKHRCERDTSIGCLLHESRSGTRVKPATQEWNQ
jgi:hypothetical protein